MSYEDLPISVDVELTYRHINALTAGTQVKTGAGVLHSVNVNKGGGAGCTVSFYDGTSTSDPLILSINTSNVLGTWFYDLKFTKGLFYTVVTGTAGDYTVSYR